MPSVGDKLENGFKNWGAIILWGQCSEVNGDCIVPFYWFVSGFCYNNVLIFSNESPITGTKMAQIAALSSIGCNLRAIAAIFALNIDLRRRISAKKMTKMCCRGPAGYSGGAGANNNKQGSNWLKVAHHLPDFGQVYPLVCHRSNGECNIGNEQQNIKFLCNPISSLPPLWFSVDRRVWSESQKIYHVFCSYQALLMTLKVIILLSV